MNRGHGFVSSRIRPILRARSASSISHAPVRLPARRAGGGPARRACFPESRRLAADVPPSPLTLYATALPHGTSGGFFTAGESAADYAARGADLG